MSTTTLASLALLKANIDTEGRDVLDMIMPLVEFAGSKSGLRTRFSSSDLNAAILKELGLVLPVRAVDLILQRIQRRGSATHDSGLYSINKWQVDPTLIEQDRSELLRRSNDIVERLRTFVEERHKVRWSFDESRDALDDYVDTYSIECIRAYAAASPVPVHGKSPNNAHYLVSSFANSISEGDSLRFELLVDVVKGRMLANAILGEDLVDQKQNFKGTTLFLDTPLVLKASGLNGPSDQSLVNSLVNLGTKAGASWAVFEHTLGEADTILRVVQRNLEYSKEGHGNVYFYAKEAGYSASDITLLRSQILGLLQAKHIQLQPTPSYIASLQIDEAALEVEFRTAGLHHSNQAALRHDINSIRSIYVLRKDAHPRRLESCRAALVTANSGLARGACVYGRRHEASREVSTVVTEYSLANLLWLKWPLQAPEVPKYILATSCQAALRPSSRLWQSFLCEAEKLERMGSLSPEQHAFLRFESRVRVDLMDLTFGDESTLDAKLILQILTAYEEDIRRPLKRQLDDEKVRRTDMEQTIEESRKTEKQLVERLYVEEQRRTRLRRSVAWWAYNAGRLVAILCIAAGVSLLCAGLLWQMPGWNGLVRLIPSGLLVLAGVGTLVLSLLNLTVGVTLRTPVAWLRSWVERRVYSMLTKRLEIADDDDPMR